jgi:hypothetical protein
MINAADVLRFATLGLGLSTVAAAIVHAAAPSRASFTAAIALVCTTVACGLLGTVAGLIHSFAGVAGVDPSLKATLLAKGISEAMSCTAFGLGALALWIAPFVIGTVRRTRRG